MDLKLTRKITTATVAVAIAAAGGLAVSSPASAREPSTSTKDNCWIWTGNVTKPTSSTRRVSVSVRCPYNHTVRYAYVGLWQDNSGGFDKSIGTNHTLWSAGTKLTGNITYKKTVTWKSSASDLYARFTFQNTKWQTPAVVESYSNARTVTNKPPVEPVITNQAPVAQANSMGFTFRPADGIGTQKCNSINVLSNDADPDGDALTAVATGANFTNNAPAGTYYTLQPDGTFSICVTRGAANSFSPANPLAVSYVAVDSKGTQSQPVNVVIAPSLVNSAPSAGSNSMGFTFRAADAVGTQKCNAINVLTNDGDADGDPLTAVATGANFNNNAPYGTYFTMQPNGTFSICVTRGAANSFSPANPLLVTYVAVDNQGAQSQPVNIFITPSLV